MALTVLFSLLTLSVSTRFAMAAPVDLQSVLQIGPVVSAVDSILLLPPSQTLVPPTALPVPTGTLIITKTDIVIVTDTLPPPTATAMLPEVVTVTDIVTVIVSPSVAPIPSGTVWVAPSQMTDLSAFNVSAFPGGQHNLQIVDGIPASASATGMALEAESTSGIPPPPTWDNSSSVLQLRYPANSINPTTKPQGGAEFYASPLQMANATNITLEYSVFFPFNFNWVLAGKLPGLYGGHTGCSGGNAALDCFSTRLMWRSGGAGELYLYAPKNKQAISLCSDPTSVCDAAYGLSIGRGTFNWTAGAWTNVRQTVALNTPGERDGGFSLDVNGKRVIDRRDVFYRDVVKLPPPPPPVLKKPKPVPVPVPPNSPHIPSKTLKPNPITIGRPVPIATKKPIPPTTKKAPTLGGILGPLLGGGLRRDVPPLLPKATPFPQGPVTDAAAAALIAAGRAAQTPFAILFGPESVLGVVDVISTVTLTATATATKTVTAMVTSTAYPSLMPIAMQSSLHAGKPVPFVGIFFSTFFGGHQREYATPTDQYSWFKDFGLTFNS